MQPSVVMQQNDLSTLSNKWSFLFHSIEEINPLTIVVLESNGLTRLKEIIKQHTFYVPLNAQKDCYEYSSIRNILYNASTATCLESLMKENQHHKRRRSDNQHNAFTIQ
uniref:CBS domain-containing protein n=1 Tax=Heterorhabditis bacteriophora TaxID=37862 RepID=A0A1I7WUZ1_HETBA